MPQEYKLHLPFKNRRDAGEKLAERILSMSLKDPIIIALPRGGVPVAFEIAKALQAPLDVLIVRKIGAPSRSEFGIGAITENGYYWIDTKSAQAFGATEMEIENAIAKEYQEVERRIGKYRKDRPLPFLRGKNVVVVDDGLATGATARVACNYLREQGAAKIILAVPVCSPRTASFFQSEIEQMICLAEPENFFGVGQFYEDFAQTSDQEVISLIERAMIWRKKALSIAAGSEVSLVEAIQKRAVPLKDVKDLKPLIDEISQARIVMLGEASHGTHEFYEWRRIISEWLIVKHGFSFIAVEGDWPACMDINQYVHGEAGQKTHKLLGKFNRWPTWMWANTDIIKLLHWMRTHNQSLPKGKQVGFFGLDVYSLFESSEAVLKQLEKINPFLARRAKLRYACFDPYQRDERAYAKSLIEIPEGCEEEVKQTLQDLLEARLKGTKDQDDAFFDAEQNARIVVNAEHYYRTMIHADEDSWNVRDWHMTDTLDYLLKHHGDNSKAIVWAHNTHIGDYRATDMAKQGQINIGGLAREKWGKENVALVGFGTDHGEVTASHAWDGPIETMIVPPGRSESYEAAFHEVSKVLSLRSYFISLRDESAQNGPLAEVLGHRAIGVVYHPDREHFGNYVPTSLAKRYDAFLFVDETTAIQPLAQQFDRKEIPETWPNGQ